jgi:aryl-alcohol dehydrogenase-like predicted oxidoreductase
MEPMTNRRTLGQSDLQLSPLGLGCWQFSKGNGMVGKYWPLLSDDDILAIINMSVDGGMNWFDTAEVYGHGQSEKVLARSLDVLAAQGNSMNDLYIATKWWPLLRSARSITHTIDERIDALGNRMIDLYQIHQPLSISTVAKQMEAMADLVKRGKIRYVGVSNFSAKSMRLADQELRKYGLRLVSNQVKYSLLDRKIEQNGILETAKELGISIIAYSPLEQGLLTGKFHQNPELISNSSGPRKYMAKYRKSGLAKSQPLIDLLQSLANKYQRSVSQIALNWTIHFHGNTVFAIPGASKLSHASDNVGAMQFTLTQEELEAISQQSFAVR